MFDIIQQGAYDFKRYEKKKFLHFNSYFHLIPYGHKLWTVPRNPNKGMDHLNIDWESTSRIG